MPQMKQSDLNAWKPLTLEGSVFSGGIDGLIGVEELTDYKLEKKNNKTKIVICDVGSETSKDKVSLKRKSLNEWQEDTIDDNEPELRKAKSRNHKDGIIKKKKKKTERNGNVDLSLKSDKKGQCHSKNDDSESEMDHKDGTIKKKKKKTERNGNVNLGLKSVKKNQSHSQNDDSKSEVDHKDSTIKKKKKKTERNENVDLSLKSDKKSEFHSQNDDSESEVDNFNMQAWSVLGVPKMIIKALEDQQFYSPTTIQMLTLPPAILGRRDILGAAETGSGKTLAFGIPILNGILELKNKSIIEPSNNSISKLSNKTRNEGWTCTESKTTENDNSSSESDYEEDDDVDKNNIGCVRVINNIEISKPQNYAQKPLYALILTPTRELAIQIKNHLTKAAKYTDIKIAVVLGGMAEVKQERILRKGPEIVIATPGRLWELIQMGNPHLNQVESIKYFVIDETDRMLERGHFQELQQLLEKINMNKDSLQKRQTFVFSATLTMVHDIPEHLHKKKKNYRNRIFKLTSGQKLQKFIDLIGIKNPKIVDITKESGTASNLTECRIVCTIDHKDYYLYYFLKRYTGRTLVFCNSIGCVKRLATLFGILNCKPLSLHANMQQRQRLKNLERFQADKNGLLIATDVAARGLDIPNVEHVIHYQVPRTSESYVHRSGRTARAQKEGLTVLMMEPSEKQYYTKLCKTLDRTEDLPVFPIVDRLLIAVKERVDVARDIDKLELKCRRDTSKKSWLLKAVEEMDLLLDEDEEELQSETKELADMKRQLKMKRRYLDSLLLKPLFPKGFSGKYLDINIESPLANDNEKAVNIMKKVIEEIPQKQKERNKLSSRKKTILKNKILKKKKKSLKGNKTNKTEHTASIRENKRK
ncbi:ATP-dependent RNA helicase DDX24 [Megalopta genalis]|uniref:ATP-dependent RNA helicase DDX24 n=1 Tax=Megalopta genalis TaxID=115081 RepID=UPI003FCF65A3